uniref:Uncharacterized protein n=1 Tax=Odontella aurita TaxID=265563 RepID=A0A7S4K2Q6_9STRA|mmetsp:Transcript_60107/g.178209  ORF Transcript_60107/g.178209 Transcript_60107/m.178209 type:complete len:367 (+) Transcript_60107:124-1224(+)
MSLPSWLPLAVAGASTIVLVVLALILPRQKKYPSSPINVAFIGNSMQYYNDCPRFMEALSSGHINQNSCLHGGATLSYILLTGSGTSDIFNTENALRSDGTYDMGACSVPQLLFGYDDNLYDVANYNYDDDFIVESNPCSQGMYSYVVAEGLTGSAWDFIVMNDNTRHPGVEENREESIATLKGTYVAYFLETGATPVFIDTHAYGANAGGRDTSDFDGIPDFTSKTYYGYRLYADVVGGYLPKRQAPRIAPVGIAFLVVYEEDHDLWFKLFNYDDVHASPHGTYLQGCVLHATLFGSMPYQKTALGDVSELWSRARRMAPPDFPVMSFPTVEEARYLFKVAQMVTLKGYRPKSFVDYYTESLSED